MIWIILFSIFIGMGILLFFVMYKEVMCNMVLEYILVFKEFLKSF